MSKKQTDQSKKEYDYKNHDPDSAEAKKRRVERAAKRRPAWVE